MQQEHGKLKTIYKTPSTARAALIRQLLTDAGIQVTVSGEHQGGLAGLNVAPVEIIVLESDADAAKEIIADAETRE